MPAYRSRTGCIYRRNGPKTRPAERRRVFPRRSHSRPNRSLRLSRFAPPVRRVSHVGLCFLTQATGSIRRCAPASVRSASVMWRPSRLQSKCVQSPKLASWSSHERQRVGAQPAKTCLVRITWREGTNDRLRSRFARVRVHTSPTRGRRERPEETLLIEWPGDEAKPTKYWLSTLDENISFRELVDTAKMRWRVERDYQELKQEVGLGHFEGRSWPGFHHHGTLCIAIYGFLISEREMIPPSGPCSAGGLKRPALPRSYRPRGTPNPAPTTCPRLDRDPSPPTGSRARPTAAALPVLRTHPRTKHASCSMTQ